MSCCASASSSAYKLIFIGAAGEEDLGVQTLRLLRVVKGLGVRWVHEGRVGSWRIISEVKGERTDHGKLTIADGQYGIEWA